MPAFTTNELLSELRLRIATGGMMPIPQLGLVETELMWRCMWDVVETQIISELQAAREKSGAVVNNDDGNDSGAGAGDRGQGLKLGVGTGAGGGSAFYITAKNVVNDGGSPVTVTVSQDYLSHYNLKCSREFLTEGSSMSHQQSITNGGTKAFTIRQADINAAKMYFEVANGCSDSTTTTKQQQNSEDSRPSTASSVSSSIPNKKSISLKASRNFSHELCRRFIRTVAEIIGEKGAKWDVHVEFPHFGLLRIKDRILDFTPAFSPKLMVSMGSSSSGGVVVGAAGGEGGSTIVMSKPSLTPFGGGDTEETNGSGGNGGGGGSPLQRVLRQQARERMLLQKHGDSYIRARVDAKKNAAIKGGFNSAGIGAPHTVVDTSDTDSLFTIRPISKSGGGAGGGTHQGTAAPSTTNSTAVADMKRLLISHRHMRPPSATPSSTNNNNTLPRVGGGGGGGGRSSQAPPPSGAALVRSLDHQLQELRNQLSGPLESVECDLLAIAREDTSPTKQHQKDDDHEGGGSSSPKKNRAKSSLSRATPIPALPTTRQLNFRHGQQQYARRSAKLMDNDNVQEQTIKARMYKQDLDLQNTISSTTKKSKKQLEIDADSRRIEIDVLTAAQNILVGLSDKKTMTAQMSVEAANIAKNKDLKHERDMLRRAGKRGKHHPQPKHIV